MNELCRLTLEVILHSSRLVSYRGVDIGIFLRDARNRDVVIRHPGREPTWTYSRRSRKNIPMAAPGYLKSSTWDRGLLLVEQGEEFAPVFLHAGVFPAEQVENLE